MPLSRMYIAVFFFYFLYFVFVCFQSFCSRLLKGKKSRRRGAPPLGREFERGGETLLCQLSIE